MIISISYLLGIEVNLNSETILFAGWVHIFFGALLCFDAYVQNIEDYFNNLCKENRTEYRHLINENILLKPKIYEQQNILGNIKAQIEIIKEKEENKVKLKNKKSELMKFKTIKIDINAKEGEKAGDDLINQFINIFSKATEENKVKLSTSNNKMKIIIILKKIFEEIIIFFFICTAVVKLNIWSTLYVLYSIYLILTTRTMKKYYILFK